MQLEVGTIIEGKVTGITKFGAFIELPGNKTGMVHISEVSTTYVKEISDFLKPDQQVKVKVLNIAGDGKISLSIKKAQDNPPPQQSYQPRRSTSGPRTDNFEWKSRSQSTEGMPFEDMLTKFKQSSDDKLLDLKKSINLRKGSTNRRGGSSR
ncbi:S1 RNA-binding domain-containing protein [Oscillospiraceae bacterium MB08-C2-2]|nr:S1 RNA-binding domain-containing protein [Oscillospiraceae bacterium MB08-C2-2]